MVAPLIGMRFLSFLILLILSAFAAAVIHWGARYRFLQGTDGFVGMWIIAWICAWLGPYVFGFWFGPVMLWNVYIIPALIGAFVGAFGTAACYSAIIRGRRERGAFTTLEHHEAA